MIFLHTKWSDIEIESFAGEVFLIQGRKNKITRASSFRIVKFTQLFTLKSVNHMTKESLITANLWETNK